MKGEIGRQWEGQGKVFMKQGDRTLLSTGGRLGKQEVGVWLREGGPSGWGRIAIKAALEAV
jgi:hypothetical protein